MKRRNIFIVAIVLILICVISCPLALLLKRNVENNFLLRDDSRLKIMNSNVPKDFGYTSSYEGYLPKMVQNDLETVQKQKLDGVTYFLTEDSEITVTKNGEAIVQTPQSFCRVSKPSIFSTKEGIVVYGISRRKFVKISPQGIMTEVLENIDIPDTIKTYGNNIYPLRNSTLVVEEGKVALYRRQEEIASSMLQEKETLKQWSYGNYLGFETNLGNNYMLFLEENDSPWLEAVPLLDTIQGEILSQKATFLVQGRTVYVPIKQGNDGKHYISLPDDLDTFIQYNFQYIDSNIEIMNEKQREDGGVGVHTICIEERLGKGNIYYEFYQTGFYHVWYVQWLLGTYPNTRINIQIDGYDVTKQLPQQEVEKLTTTVYSIEEYQKAINQIRAAYEEL